MPEVRSHRSGTFCWADLSTPDLTGTIAFYSELFNWRAVPLDTPEEHGRGVLFQKDGKNVAGAVELAPEARDAETPGAWQGFLATKGVDALCERAASLGATVIEPPSEIPGAARLAALADPEGARFTLYQAEGEIGAQLLNEPGALCWFELFTGDLSAGPGFYAELFGYELRPVKGASGQPYVQLGIGRGAAAGALEIPPEWEIPPTWMVYFQTEDLAAAIDRAERHGATLLMAPMVAPGVGQFAMLEDPQGARLMLLQVGSAQAPASPPAPPEEATSDPAISDEASLDEATSDPAISDEASLDEATSDEATPENPDEYA